MNIQKHNMLLYLEKRGGGGNLNFRKLKFHKISVGGVRHGSLLSPGRTWKAGPEWGEGSVFILA